MKPLAIVAWVNVSLWCGVATATPTFPGVISDTLQLDYRPPCNICHSSTSGGGPMATPFGRALVDSGLRANNEGSLRSALGKLETDGVDSNSNGSSDIDDLRAGIDPNQPGSQSLTSAPPMEYGCVGQVATSRPNASAAIVTLGLALGLLMTTRKNAALRLRKGQLRSRSRSERPSQQD